MTPNEEPIPLKPDPAPTPSIAAQDAELVRAGDDMAEALKHLWSGLVAIKPLLDRAYPDDPRWTPWSRFVEHELDIAMTARETWQEGRTDG